MKLLLVEEQEVYSLLPMADCIEVMAEMFGTLARGDAVQPLRQAVWQPDRKGVLGLMPAYLGNPRAIGAKVISVFPGNVNTPYESHQGVVLLFECEFGRLLAVIDASAVTAVRTAAVSALATRLLAREEASTLAILGSGTQASMHLQAMGAVRPIGRARVWSRTPERARRFVQRESARYPFPVEAVASAEEAVRGADIICTTTAAIAPILEGCWLEPGAHVNAVGASRQGFRELDSEAVARSGLFVDRRESTFNEAEDFLAPRQEGLIGDDHILGEIGELVLGKVAGRVNADDITLFKSLGLAVEDLAAADHIYKKALEGGLGSWLEFGGERHE
ncbi:MAG TPA: ornithine cyclodeaminase family protein [Dehalococcoidia bacterium]|nr:ornithine cyclodeaminase family protein [Dehalococcoidia bacterium]